jgi:hypothetical protein
VATDRRPITAEAHVAEPLALVEEAVVEGHPFILP